jgi:hypothetical protein
VDAEENGLYTTRSIMWMTVALLKDILPQQKAQAWLEGVAEEPDKVKDLVMQQLWKQEDFQNA